MHQCQRRLGWLADQGDNRGSHVRGSSRSLSSSQLLVPHPNAIGHLRVSCLLLCGDRISDHHDSQEK
jgi:hypothetical protein